MFTLSPAVFDSRGLGTEILHVTTVVAPYKDSLALSHGAVRSLHLSSLAALNVVYLLSCPRCAALTRCPLSARTEASLAYGARARGRWGDGELNTKSDIRSDTISWAAKVNFADALQQAPQ